MEIIIIVSGSAILPVVTIVALIVLRKRIQASRKEAEASRKEDIELIDTLEELVAIKSEQIQRLRQ